MANEDIQQFIEELRARISIVDVVGAKVKLTKKGREYQGLCPFHNEKTPSFTVNESKGFYHCFGCGAHGDIVKFEMEANGHPFMDALQKLAAQAGLQMPVLSKQDKEAHEERKSLYEVMEQASLFFERELKMPQGAEGLKYFMEKRGLSKETIQKFRLGFAPNNNGLMALLKSQNIAEKDMKDLGLIAIPEDKSRRPHDFFRNRVMIPIMNKQGKIIAFGGRVMEKIEPKYLNSPETPIFNKRRNLYNLDKAREVAYKEKKLIICEGYMDVIALDSYGFSYAVAPLGTALTEEQITEAWKVCDVPTLCLDGDAPGVKAAMRAVDRVLPILKAGKSLQFLFLPDNMDPDEYLKAHGHGSFAALLTKTRPLIDILWQKYTENQDSSTPEQKALIERTLLSEVAKIGDATVRSYYAQEIRNRIYKAFKQTPWSNKPIPAPRPIPSEPAYFNETPPINGAEPPSYLENIPLPDDNFIPDGQPFESAAEIPPRPAVNVPQTHRVYQKKRPAGAARPPLNHLHTLPSSPEALNKTVIAEDNIRFVLAAELIYPELIDDFEEQVYTDNITNPNLKLLYTTMADIYHNAENVLSSEDLEKELKATPAAATLKDLWHLDMLKAQPPFINTMRQEIIRRLDSDRLTVIEKEIKDLKLNPSDENLIRLQELITERNEILAKAAVVTD